MTEQKKTAPDTTREEDYRDYDKRNIGEGWPYADQDMRPAERNAPYGTTTSNLDEAGNIGAEVENRPVIHSHGGPNPAASAEHGVIEDDDLEERIFNALESDSALDTDLFTVTVHNGIANLEGRVETKALRLRVETLVLSVKGVRGCNNRLTTIGADSHIPSDADI